MAPHFFKEDLQMKITDLFFEDGVDWLRHKDDAKFDGEVDD